MIKLLSGMWVGVAMLLWTGGALACSSDFDCGTGNTCVKAPLDSRGVCMRTVDEYGTRQYNLPSTRSIGPNMNLSGQCDFTTDCPIGFRCDSELKACVNR